MACESGPTSFGWTMVYCICDPSPNRVHMSVFHQREQVGVLITKNRLVPSLKKMTHRQLNRCFIDLPLEYPSWSLSKILLVTCLGALKALDRRGALQGFFIFKLHLSMRRLNRALSWAYLRRRVDLEQSPVTISRNWKISSEPIESKDRSPTKLGFKPLEEGLVASNGSWSQVGSLVVTE